MENHKTYKKPIYPPDWSTISLAIKEARNWQCELCLIHQGDNPHHNITVHHKDHNTFNNAPSNLLVLCQSCHLIQEGIWRRYHLCLRKIKSAFKLGQLILPGFEQLLYPQLNTIDSIPPSLLRETGIESASSLV